MKINILFLISDSALGGGNQFLKALKVILQKRGLYAELEEADVVIFNSHHYVAEVIAAKRRYSNKIFIHRIDGLMKLYNKPEDKRDSIVWLANKWISDGNIYQSNWSRERNYEFGMEKSRFENTIYNAADSSIFNHNGKIEFDRRRKTKIIATSWSSNIKKGFDVYKYLDETLDWNKYEMTFVGNSPLEFHNIKHKQPMISSDLSKELKNHDIYISASQKDPCSNSVIEALSCGLPVLCLNDGGHPELVKEGGLLFQKEEEIPTLLEKLATHYEEYQRRIRVNSMEKVGDGYILLAEQIKCAVDVGYYKPKSIKYFQSKKILKEIKTYYNN